MKADTSRPAAGSTNKRLSRIVLGSSSPRRLELLRSLGLTVEVTPSDYGEPAAAGLSPAQLASYHAREKLAAVMRLRRGAGVDAPVLTADTVVDLEGSALGKPRDADEAFGMLRRLSGRDHLVHTAFALTVPGIPDWTVERATTRVRFYSLEPGEIAEYVATGEPLDKAGAYGIQGRAAALVEAIDGDFYTVMGLPLGRFVRVLGRLGFALPETK
ncbi:MAG: septum formation protein Maf [Candidatus Eremiobacteraeota bacterium]|nr:septum formation protein Maf [Candidatus Eremiobacteraeota bacterium]MBV8497859.1 septum formation protein Maf [Candidatus Eremiobacteraeota bacterium]